MFVTVALDNCELLNCLAKEWKYQRQIDMEKREDRQEKSSWYLGRWFAKDLAYWEKKMQVIHEKIARLKQKQVNTTTLHRFRWPWALFSSYAFLTRMLAASNSCVFLVQRRADFRHVRNRSEPAEMPGGAHGWHPPHRSELLSESALSSSVSRRRLVSTRTSQAAARPRRPSR
jgi:hypothetical protein